MTQADGPFSYRRIITAVGSGDVIADEILSVPVTVEPDTFLDYFSGLFGEPTDAAVVELDGERMPIGWFFRATGEIAGQEPREIEVVPMVEDPAKPGELISFYVAQARAKADFITTMQSHGVPTTIATVHQRAADDEPDVDITPP